MGRQEEEQIEKDTETEVLCTADALGAKKSLAIVIFAAVALVDIFFVFSTADKKCSQLKSTAEKADAKTPGTKNNLRAPRG